MALMNRRRKIDRILDPQYVTDLDALSIGELRARLEESRGMDDELSFQRRWLHGNLDILRDEAERRQGADGLSSDVVERLKRILSVSRNVSSSRGARPRMPKDMPVGARRELDRLFSEAALSRVSEMDAAELAGTVERLADKEADVSSRRREVQRVIDALEGELGARYKDGRARPEDLLRPR